MVSYGVIDLQNYLMKVDGTNLLAAGCSLALLLSPLQAISTGVGGVDITLFSEFYIGFATCPLLRISNIIPNGLKLMVVELFDGSKAEEENELATSHLMEEIVTSVTRPQSGLLPRLPCASTPAIAQCGAPDEGKG